MSPENLRNSAVPAVKTRRSVAENEQHVGRTRTGHGVGETGAAGVRDGAR